MAQVTVYSTPTCVYCKMAKAFFDENSVEYTDKNVAEDEEARREMFEKTHQMGVPVIDVDGKTFIGFDKQGLSEALGISG